MRQLASINIVMQFATYESASGQFSDVEPEHLLMGLFKFSELQRHEVEKFGPGGSGMMVEIEALHNELTHRAMDSTSLRRELRAKKGQGRSPFQGGVMHRSPETRRLFDQAAELAVGEGCGSLQAKYLLQAVLACPTPLIEQTVGHIVANVKEDKKEAILLDTYGEDLTALALEGKIPIDSDRKAESKALVQVLLNSDKPAVFLVCKSDLVFASIIKATAQHLSENRADNNKGAIHVIDVTDARDCPEWDTEMLDRFRQISSEASRRENVVLVVPALEPAGKRNGADDWIETMESLLAQQSVRFVCQVDPGVYDSSVRTRPALSRLGNVIWIREDVDHTVPREL